MTAFLRPKKTLRFFHSSHKSLLSGLMIIVGILLSMQYAHAATYTLTTANAANAQLPSSWNTGGTGGGGSAASTFTTSGDIFTIATGTSATFASGTSTVFGSGVTLQVNGSFTIGIGDNNVTSSVTVNGTIILNNTSATQNGKIGVNPTAITGGTVDVTGSYSAISGLGRHYLQAQERGGAGATFNGGVLFGLEASLSGI
jgi:hypothetical protein